MFFQILLVKLNSTKFYFKQS